MTKPAKQPTDGGWFKRVHERFERHHDHISAVRQRAIANLACLVSISMAGLYYVAVNNWDWNLEISTATGIAVATLWSLGFAGMIYASSLPNILRKTWDQLGDGPAYEELDEPPWLTTSRKYAYYPAAYATFVATGISVEMSGGLVNSPFTAVFFTMILGAQQLSRYKLNSRLFIIFGVSATLLLALYQEVFGIQPQPTAPPALSFSILAASFLVTALCTHAAKPINYRPSGDYPDPTHAELHYGHGEGRWRFALYNRGTQLDPLIDADEQSLTVGEAEEKVATIALSLCTHGQSHIDWRTADRGTEAVGYIRPPAPGTPTPAIGQVDDPDPDRPAEPVS